MKNYKLALQKHLERYAEQRLGVTEKGEWRGRAYAHILPGRHWHLNLLEPYRKQLMAYCQAHPSIKRHQGFHHLNSSQAFAFNLFYPYFSGGGTAAQALTRALGVPGQVSDWQFECVPDVKEGTNVDVMWHVDPAETVFCEVKLSESDFGPAVADEKHRTKLSEVYRPRLEPMISADLVEERVFFKHYQILRNISLLAVHRASQLVFLFPQANAALSAPLQRVLSGLDAKTRDRVRIAHAEHCIRDLARDTSLTPELRLHAERLAEKYLIPTLPSSKP